MEWGRGGNENNIKRRMWLSINNHTSKNGPKKWYAIFGSIWGKKEGNFETKIRPKSTLRTTKQTAPPSHMRLRMDFFFLLFLLSSPPTEWSLGVFFCFIKSPFTPCSSSSFSPSNPVQFFVFRGFPKEEGHLRGRLDYHDLQELLDYRGRGGG